MNEILVVLFLGFGFAAWDYFKNKQALSAGSGVPPHPHVPVIDVGGARVVDLRGVSHEVLLSTAGIAWGLEARRILPPVTLCVWVVPDEVLDAWMQNSEVVWVIIGSRMREHRKTASPPAIDGLYVPEGRYSDDLLAGPKAGGLTIVHDVEVLGTDVTFASMLDVAPPAPVGIVRPELGGSSFGLLGVLDFVWSTFGLTFVDLRRASLAGLDSFAVFAHVDESLAHTPKGQPVIWVFAPWVLAQWNGREEEVAARLGESLVAHGGRDHQLAVDGPGADPAFLAVLESAGLRTLDGALAVEGPDRNFTVPLLEVLRDLEFLSAIPQKKDRS